MCAFLPENSMEQEQGIYRPHGNTNDYTGIGYRPCYHCYPTAPIIISRQLNRPKSCECVRLLGPCYILTRNIQSPPLRPLTSKKLWSPENLTTACTLHLNYVIELTSLVTTVSQQRAWRLRRLGLAGAHALRAASPKAS